MKKIMSDEAFVDAVFDAVVVANAKLDSAITRLEKFATLLDAEHKELLRDMAEAMEQHRHRLRRLTGATGSNVSPLRIVE